MEQTENERLKNLREDLKLSQTLFAQTLGIKAGSLSDIERGRIGISASLLKELANKYKVNPTWILLGIGSTYLPGHDKYNSEADNIAVSTQANQLQTDPFQIFAEKVAQEITKHTAADTQRVNKQLTHIRTEMQEVVGKVSELWQEQNSLKNDLSEVKKTLKKQRV